LWDAGFEVARTGVNTALDIAQAPFTDDDYEGFVGTILGVTLDRGSEALEHLIGPEGVGGVLIGALPEPVRKGGSDVLEGMEWAYREGVGEPLSTAATMLGAAKGDPSVLFDSGDWKSAYRIAQGRSPGQAVALALLTDDTLDDNALARYEGNRWFSIVSGTMDAAARVFLDPTVLGGKVAVAVRGANRAARVRNYFESTGRAAGGYRQFADDVRVVAGESDGTVEMLAGRLREKYFKGHPDGDLVTVELAQAFLGHGGFSGGRHSMENVMRFFMGETSAVRRIAEESPAAAYRFEALFKQANRVDQTAPAGTPGVQAKAFNDAYDDLPEGVLSEIDEAHTSNLFATLDEAVRPTRRIDWADRVNTSAWYRSHWSMAPVRVLRDMRPQHIVWAGDANSGEQVVRMMQEAGYTPDQITRFRGRWAGANRNNRVSIFEDTQTEIINGLIDKHFPGLDDAAKQTLRRDFSESSAAADRALRKTTKYDADKNLSTVKVPKDDGTFELIQVPLTPGQLQQTFTMVDVKKLDRFLERRASRYPEGLFKAGDLAGDSLSMVMSWWRPAQLLRPAWAIRVVGDEQLRMMAKLGVVNRMHDLLVSNRREYVERVLARKVLSADGVDKGKAAGLTARRAAVTGALSGALAGPVGVGLGAGFSFARNRHAIRKLTKKVDLQREAVRIAEDEGATAARAFLRKNGHDPTLNIAGVETQAAFGDSVALQIVWMKANSANRQVHYLLLDEERAIFDDTRQTLGNWTRELDPWELQSHQTEAIRDYGNYWERVVNDQYASNGAGRIAFDDTVDDRVAALVGWLDDTPEGRQFIESNPHRFRKDDNGVLEAGVREEWAETLTQAADRMVVDPALRARLAEGERVRFSDVEQYAAEADLNWRDMVGSIHAQDEYITVAKGPADRARRFVDKAYTRMGTLPTDTLSRNPYFRHVYQKEMERRIGKFKAGDHYELSDEALRGIEHSARRKALEETRHLLYDLAESSQFADLMRNVMPFYNAWQEVLSRWAGLAWENPVFATRFGTGLRADVSVPGFVDTVEVDGERYYQMRLPEFAKGLLKSGFAGRAVDELGTVRFRADSLNMITQGLPGFGPLAQIPATRLVTTRPELEDALKFVLPYGPLRGRNEFERLSSSMQPAWLKRITSALSEDRSFESAAATIMLTRLTDMYNGEADELDFDNGHARAEFIADVRRDAKHFMFIRSVASAVSPAAVGFHSPYQGWIDRYRELRSENYHTADEMFLKELSAEGQRGFYAMAARFSKNNEGLPSTLQSEKQRQKYIDLVRKYPDVGGLILGSEGAGQAKWSSAVYERQLTEDTSPGSGVKRRERMSLDEILTNSREREGWAEYGKLNDAVYVELKARGLPNLRVSGARDLLQMKQAGVKALAERYPLWFEAYSNPDLTKWQRRIDGMRAIVKDERLSQRDDIQLLAQYLEIRDAFTLELARRGAAGGATTLSAGSNQDLKAVWEEVGDRLTENPTFSELLWRWLEFDPLASNTWPEEHQMLKEAA